MKMLHLDQFYPRETLRLAPIAMPAFALSFLALTSAVLPAQTVRAESTQVMEEIVVTARKREESLQEVAGAVSVLTDEVITAQRIEGIKDLGTIIPGMVAGRTGSGTAGNIYLRGVGTGRSNPSFDQAVSINIDGVGISSAALLNAGMFDVERIEVLRGPQALFYGKNSPGGVIVIHTKDPTDEFELELSAMYETEGKEPAVRAIISGPLGDTLGARLSVGWSDADNHLFDVYNIDVFETGPDGQPVQTAFSTDKDPVQTEKIFAIGTLLWEPADNFSAKLKVAHQTVDRGAYFFNFQRTQCSQGAPQVIYPVPGIDDCKMDGKLVGPGINPLLGPFELAFPDYVGDGFGDEEDNFVALEMTYEMDNDLILTSVTGYYDNHIDRLGEASSQAAAGLYNGIVLDLEQWSQEFRLTSNYAGPVNFSLGAFYEEKDLYGETSVTLGSNIIGLPVGALGVFAIPLGRQLNWQDSVAYSVFGQLDWAFAENWRLTAGARYTYEEKKSDISVDFPGRAAIDILLLDDKPDWTNVSPELTLSYQYSDDIMFFASYRTGFKSGGFDHAYKTSNLVTLAGAGLPYDPVYDEEEVDGFEVGMKSTLLDGTLRFNATAYRYDYDDLQLSLTRFLADGSPTLLVLNAAKSSLAGLELETFWITPVDGLTLTANIAFLDTEFDEYTPPCIRGQTVALGCNVNPDPVTGRFANADMSGEPLSLAPDWSATFALDYSVPLGSSWIVAFNLTTSYKDDYNQTSELIPDDWQMDGFWWTNASVSLNTADDRWEFYVRGVNLGDEQYTVMGLSAFGSGNPALTGTNDPSGLPDFLEYVEGGRQITVGMTYRM